jgi:pimeloyl-ACP methyl ester carboxylesterase
VSTVVVYVHGLWLNGWEALLLRRRLARLLACETLSFNYSSISADLSGNARALAEFLQRIPAETLHLVGHSMGGVLILELFEGAPQLPPGRIVLLGSPVQGSRAARNLAGGPLGRRIIGLTAHQALLPQQERRWQGARELGVIAGTLALGFGRLLGSFDEPSDGTVLVAETRLAGAKEQLSLRTSHTGMVYSSRVARHAATFLREGRFDVDPDQTRM